MFCSKCGAQIMDGENFCTNCGEKVMAENTAFSVEPAAEENTVIQSEGSYVESVAPQGEAFVENTEPQPPKKNFAVKLIAIIVAACLVVGGGIFGIIAIKNNSEKEELHKLLMKDWDRVEESDGTYFTLKLDFSEDEIEYWFDSFFIDDKIATYDYEVVSKNEIRINGYSKLYTIEFNDEKTMMTITPAITSTDRYEHWFCLD